MPGNRVEVNSRPFEEVRQNMLTRAETHRNPFYYTPYDEVKDLLGRLDSTEPEAWATLFSDAAEPYEERARRSEADGDVEAAVRSYLIAYNYLHVGWYPAPSSPGKLRAYRRSVDTYLKAARYFDPPLERVEIPFRARPGEGKIVIGYLRIPKNSQSPPVAVIWGGIDAYKEERQVDLYLASGMATLTIDIPGTGEAPILGSQDAERLWDDVFDWVAAQPNLDGKRVGVVGASTGGYWAAKLAHTHCRRIKAAVNHGGMAHFAFTSQWIVEAQRGEYPFELAESLAMTVGLSTCQDWIDFSPKLSLLGQGILDEPCAPLLLVNGIKDTVFPISDMYLLLEHGSPKSARFYPIGHMGRTKDTEPMIVRWLQAHLM